MTFRGNTEANVKFAALAARFVDGPHVSAPDKAEQRLADWLTDLSPEQAAAIGDLIARFPLTKTILLGIAEASPYLFDLVRADGARTIRLLECEPESYLAELIEKTCRDVSAASSEADVMQLLRRMKSEAAHDDCTVRYRRRLAGDAGDGGADRPCGRVGAIGAAACTATGSRARTVVASKPR